MRVRREQGSFEAFIRIAKHFGFGCGALCFALAPASAQKYGVTVAPPPVTLPPSPTSPPPNSVYPYPAYPLPGWVRPNSVRCEQDRLLTDATPCGMESPVQLPPCQQDRLLTDHTPCTKQ